MIFAKMVKMYRLISLFLLYFSSLVSTYLVTLDRKITRAEKRVFQKSLHLRTCYVPIQGSSIMLLKYLFIFGICFAFSEAAVFLHPGNWVGIEHFFKNRAAHHKIFSKRLKK